MRNKNERVSRREERDGKTVRDTRANERGLGSTEILENGVYKHLTTGQKTYIRLVLVNLTVVHMFLSYKSHSIIMYIDIQFSCQ